MWWEPLTPRKTQPCLSICRISSALVIVCIVHIAERLSIRARKRPRSLSDLRLIDSLHVEAGKPNVPHQPLIKVWLMERVQHSG